MPYNRSFFAHYLPRTRAIRADLEARGIAFTPAAVAPILGISRNSAARLVGRLRALEPGSAPAPVPPADPATLARRADQEARLLAARAGLVALGKDPTAGRLAVATGWSTSLVVAVRSRLCAPGDWPADPQSGPAVADVPPPPQPVRVEPDIATECAAIRDDWTPTRWARQSGDRAPVRVARGIDHHQRLITHKYGI